MFRRISILFFLLALTSCGVFKKKPKTVTVKASDKRPTVVVEGGAENNVARKPIHKNTPRTAVTQVDKIINTALTYSGTRYKYGGTTKKGMDCSGLLYVSFGEHNVKLPRVSYHMAEEGKKVKLKNAEKGDLIFFRIGRRSKRINHVGIVVEAKNDDIKFIHASSSRGVTISSLKQDYWTKAFVKVNRVL